MTDARAAVFEIVERRKKPEPGSLAESIIVPNIVRVNGAEIAIPQGEPITVHNINGRDDVVTVTLTVFARRIFIGDEYVDEDIIGAVDAAQKALGDAQREYAEALGRCNAAVETAQAQLAAAHRELSAATPEVPA